MTFISYAQNFEDVMLWRALKHVENGFYIDVGANDPTLYSVTKAFYDRGWNGINLEPVTQFFERLQNERPRDINLQLGAGASEGSFRFFDIPDTGLATSDAAMAQMHREQGWNVREIQVRVEPLSGICERHVTGDIHFLKIDVEGAEKEVLLGMDFARWRPWIVVIEATLPMSQQTAHENWDSLVVDAGYEYVYFDGLNRYYVARERAELKAAFKLPPNVFDNFVLNRDQESELRVAEAESRAQQSQRDRIEAERLRAEAERQRAEAEMRRIEAERMRANADEAARLAIEGLHSTQATLDNVVQRLHGAEHLIAEICSSKSWRITAPLRWGNANISQIKGAARQAVTSPRSFAARVARFGLRKSVPVIKSNPMLMAGANRLRNAFPDLSDKLLQSAKPVAAARMQQSPLALVQQDLPAWGESATPAERFKDALKLELARRAHEKN